jgi:enterochelin esterase-like enzyme
LVIVGIYNTGDRRLAEYTHEYNWQMGGGEADKYGDLLTHELMPWIADKYRVRQDRESTGMGGSSLGGLVTLYLGLRQPHVFGKLALLSPSVWWNHKSNVEHLARRLKANGWRPGETMHFEKVHEGTHDEASWAGRVRQMLKFLFPAN